MTTTVFDPTDGQDTPTPLQIQEANEALAQGEKLAEAQAADQQAKWDETSRDNDDVSLIGGKFKTQDDLLKAYNELQKKLGADQPEEESEPTEEPVEQAEEVPTEEVESEEVNTEVVDYMTQLGQEFDTSGTISDEAIDKLSQMDQKDLIRNYIAYSQKSNQGVMEADAINQIKQSVGGEQAYTDMIAWAGQNLDPAEVGQFNQVANSGNVGAIKFAVEALNNRFRNNEGYEAPMVTGGKSSKGPKPYRSQAELARDISNPMYEQDPAFRADVESRLSRSTDLL